MTSTTTADEVLTAALAASDNLPEGDGGVAESFEQQLEIAPIEHPVWRFYILR